MEVQFNINLTEGQKQAYDLLHRDDIQYLVLRWSRQCGKTILCECLLMEYLFKPNTFNVYISPTFQLGRKVYAEIIKMLEPTGIIKKANSSTLTIETTYSSTLQFFSIDGYVGIRGTTCDGICVLDECAYYPDILPNGEEPWGNVIMPIVKARKPKVVLISTPRGKRGMFWDAYLKAKEGVKGYAEISRTIYEDSLATESEIEDIKKNVSDIAFRQEFLVEFLDSSLTFFQGFENCFENFHYLEGKEYIGVDISGNGNDETIVTRINDRNEVKIHKIEGSLDSKYAQIANIFNKVNPVAIYMENNGLGAPVILEVKKLTKNPNRIHEWTTTNSSKEEIISDLAVKIANKEIHFNKEDTELYSQLGTFICTISKSKKLTFAAQAGKKDDMVMATAMALKCKNDFKYAGENNMNFIRTPLNIYR